MPEQRMSAQITKLAKKRGRLPALVTALGVAVLLVVQQLLDSLVNWLLASGVAALDDSPDSGFSNVSITYEFDPRTDLLFLYVLPMVLGVFLALWLLAPISHELDLRFTLTRAALASAAGSLLILLVGTVVALLTFLGVDINGVQVIDGGMNGTLLAQGCLLALAHAAQAFIFKTPVVMLAGVLLWLWLREHPREYDVSGLIDEV